MNLKVLLAVFQRNLASYFSSPTGYVFVCVFVALSSLAAFASPEFFNNNLATLDELNEWFPAIMLVFVPAITMSLWAEERRQSTDELLLTLPATDLDIVAGKYLASVAIFAASLAFSFVSNLIVLTSLGSPDLGVMLSTYVGYFFVGMAMLSVGMVASFLTTNLTVAFILGALFNAPLVLLQYADTIVPQSNWAQALESWSVRDNFADFGRGVFSISSLAYFLAIVGLMLFLSLVMIGRRHWLGGRDGSSKLGHYLARAAGILLLGFGLTYFFRYHDFLRADLSADELNSLSDGTDRVLDELDPESTIQIEAFVSPQVPEAYVQKRADLLALLNELDKDDDVVVRVYDTEPFSEQAQRAEDAYGITRKTVRTRDRGTEVQRDIFLGAAFRAGLNKVVVPFFDLGVPVEYELVRSIATVSKPKRKRLGVLRTDAGLFGRFSQPELIIEEFKKQYEVIEVDPSQPIVDPAKPDLKKFDVLLAAQPSSLAPPQLENLLAAVRAGVPTAIFEDPFPAWMEGVAGTSQPKRPQQPRFPGMRPPPPQPKGDVGRLWTLLGVQQVAGPGGFRRAPGGPAFDALIVWQDYNPYPKLRRARNLTNEWVFASPDAPGGEGAFNPDDPVTAGLSEVLFLLPGGIRQVDGGEMEFTYLVRTGTASGTVTFGDVQMNLRDPSELRRLEDGTGKRYTLAARVRGTPKAPAAKKGKGGQKQPEPKEVHAIVVMDIDMLDSTYLRLRAEPIEQLDLRFQDVPFVLNVIDSLAGDDRFLEMRAREQRFRTLSKLEGKLNAIRRRSERAIADMQKEYRDETKKAEKAAREAVEELQKAVREEQAKENPDYNKLKAAQARLAIRLRDAQAKEEVKKAALKRQLDRDIKQNEDDLELETRQTQDRYKVLALVLPPIPPLFLAGLILAWRRAQESRGASQTRLR